VDKITAEKLKWNRKLDDQNLMYTFSSDGMLSSEKHVDKFSIMNLTHKCRKTCVETS
jgi:hypothetical protein